MIIKAKVKPNSKEEKIEKTGEKEFIIHVKEPAEDNRANIKVINLLSREFGVSFKKIILKNPKSKDKIIEVEER